MAKTDDRASSLDRRRWVARPLLRAFFARPALAVARDLIGCLIVHRLRGRARVARIVETEAYVGPQDLACHASRGRTARTAVMFGPPGHAYVYLVYGMHHCFNVVAEREGFPAAVLVRGVEPVAGVRGATDGPGRLTRALGIDRRHNGADLCAGDLVLLPPVRRAGPLRRSPRVGVEYAGPWTLKPWRFFEAGNRYVSRRDGVRSPARVKRAKQRA